MADFFNNHSDAIFAAALPVLGALLPPVNRFLARVTGNRYVAKGLRIAKALEDGMQVEDVKALLDRR